MELGQINKFLEETVLTFLLIIFLSTIVLAFIGKYKESFIIMQSDTVITSIFLLFVSFNILKQGYRPAKFFIISSTLSGTVNFPNIKTAQWIEHFRI
ncbi:MAG: hypothetical protein EOO89_27220 [Pedobacter sp.]|nr:MAG: hypothetical protein EOO89_27220 [Pedobacter sp.]